MFAYALDPQPEEIIPRKNRIRSTLRGVQRPLSLHERLVLKAQAVFPGAIIVEHLDPSESLSRSTSLMEVE